MDILPLTARFALILVIWLCTWRYVRAENPQMRVLRAALLVVGMLVALATLRTLGI